MVFGATDTETASNRNAGTMECKHDGESATMQSHTFVALVHAAARLTGAVLIEIEREEQWSSNLEIENQQ